MYSADFCNGSGQRKASTRYAKAVKVLLSRGYTLAQVGMDREKVAADNPDVAPGLDGLPFTVNN